MSIEVRNLNRRFGATVACDNLNLDIPAGENFSVQRISDFTGLKLRLN